MKVKIMEGIKTGKLSKDKISKKPPVLGLKLSIRNNTKKNVTGIPNLENLHHRAKESYCIKNKNIEIKTIFKNKNTNPSKATSLQ
ncbi:MAG: hypothetical protein AAB795_04230 [Patescibacteria group bacterium]